MPPEAETNCLQRQIEAKRKLYPNYISLGDWKFMNINNGKVRDLSAANLDEIETIEEQDLFAC